MAKQGIAGLTRQSRSEGTSKHGDECQAFILKTYRHLSRVTRSLIPVQVALRVRVRAQALDVKDNPRCTMVYRILKPEIQKQQSKRSLPSTMPQRQRARRFP